MHILKTRNIGRQYPSSDTQRFNLSLQVFTLSLRDFRMGNLKVPILQVPGGRGCALE